MKEYYLDYAATTYVKPEVIEVMLPFFCDKFANPSSMYKIAKDSRKAVEYARWQIAKAIGADADEIYFTSGGSEADNLLIKGYARANKDKGNHIITSKIEHMAVLETCKMLEKEGFDITYLDVDENGIIDLKQMKQSINSKTILISIMFANNEIGTIEPIEEIAEIAKQNDILFHTDAVQAVGNVNIDVKKMNIGALSLSAHKFYGPKGVGALYIGKKYNFQPIISGGHQEKNKRAGTENVPGIVGMGKAIELAMENLEKHSMKLQKIRDKYIYEIFEKIPNVRLNGDRVNRLPGNANISFENVGGASLLFMLSEDKIYASSASACTAGLSAPSHVLKAIGLSDDAANSALRVTFGEKNSEEDVEYIVDKIAYNVNKLRKMKQM
ncbi:MAG: cysteine desulfurase NifS [Clostridia bacterium]|nr:cysteine desulfurase NifS [Clostridia bacterium]